MENNMAVYLLVALSLLLSACSTGRQVKGELIRANSHVSGSYSSGQAYICPNASRFKSKVVGTGHCVALIQRCSGAPKTRHWRQGEGVRGNDLEQGTVIATFKEGYYPNKTGWHAAIYISQDEQGIWVWDQWINKPVHKRLIRFKNGNGTPNNDGDAYSIVKS